MVLLKQTSCRVEFVDAPAVSSHPVCALMVLCNAGNHVAAQRRSPARLVRKVGELILVSVPDAHAAAVGSDKQAFIGRLIKAGYKIVDQTVGVERLVNDRLKLALPWIDDVNATFERSHPFAVLLVSINGKNRFAAQ